MRLMGACRFMDIRVEAMLSGASGLLGEGVTDCFGVGVGVAQ